MEGADEKKTYEIGDNLSGLGKGAVHLGEFGVAAWSAVTIAKYVLASLVVLLFIIMVLSPKDKFTDYRFSDWRLSNLLYPASNSAVV